MKMKVRKKETMMMMMEDGNPSIPNLNLYLVCQLDRDRPDQARVALAGQSFPSLPFLLLYRINRGL